MTLYKKRSGTSGIRGHLYETKLTSLIYFRAKHNDDIEEFHLATNVDKIGAFDDICFKTKIKDFDKPVVVFIQAKHRESEKVLTLNNRRYLSKLFDSYLTISRAFKPNKKDILFEGSFDETECLLVFYTNEKGDSNYDTYKGNYADCLNSIIGTGNSGTQPAYKHEDMEFLCKIVLKEQIQALAMQIAKYICDETECEMSMNDDLVLRFHVILAQKVLDISEVQPEGYRIASFRQEFFNSNEELLVFFKDILYTYVLKTQKFDDANVNADITIYLQEPTDPKILSKLIGKILKYKNGKLELVKKITEEDLIKQQLAEVYVSEVTVHEAINIAARDMLKSCQLKVPAAFGNKDLTIRGNEAKIKKRLNHLTTKFVDLLENSKPHNVVIIDESLDKGFLQLNGGIGGIIGNILVFDDDTKLLKFTNNSESLGNISKQLFKKLQDKITNLQEYRLKVNVKNFPKLSFDYSKHEENLTKDFLNKFLFYTDQADENGVEEILKNEIRFQQNYDENNLQMKSDAIFLKYHSEIQKWWMNPEKTSYLSKQSALYENILNDIIEESFIHFNKLWLCSDTKNSESDMSSQNLLNVLPNNSKDKMVKKESKRSWGSPSSFFPAKLRDKLKEIAAAVTGPTTSKYPNVEDKQRSKIVIAIYPYKANESAELSLETGAEYEIINNTDAYWWQAKNKYGYIGYIPRTLVMYEDIIGYQKYEWYVGEMSKQRAEVLLSKQGMDGCFLVRYSISEASLTISLYSKDQNKTSHYVIQQNSSGEFYLFKKSFLSIPELITYYKYNDVKSSRLTTVSSLAKWDIDPSQLVLHEIMYEGNFRVVRRGKWRDFIDTTVEIMTDPERCPDEDLIDEASIMINLKHQHLVQFYGMCFKDYPMYLVMEYMEDGSLHNYLCCCEQFTSTILLDMCIQVCKGMTYLIRNSYIHRDVEARNCFVGNNNIIKLGNFRKARYVLDDQYIATEDSTFRIRWASPEVLNETLFSSKSDIWSFGVLMWEVFSKCKVPYEKNTCQEVVDMVVQGEVLEKPNDCSGEIYEVMCTCWSHEPSDRPSFPTLLNRLNQLR